MASGQISLAWVDNAIEETGFKVEQSTDGVKFSQIALLDADTSLSDAVRKEVRASAQGKLDQLKGKPAQ